MELIRGLHNLRPHHAGAAVTIGNFDGVHRGHASLIEALAEAARARAASATLITFEPQPREFFAPGNAPPRLTRLREKLELLARTELERVLLLRFDDSLAHMSPGDFVERVLVQGLGARAVMVGEDFRFGRRAEGTVETLRAAGDAAGFDVICFETYTLEGARSSSSWVRDALAKGDFAGASALLGRPYTMSGRVMHGQRLGRTLGYATANIALKRVASALAGVFAVRVHGLGGAPLGGMANIGKRPTVGGMSERLEVHLFDFDEDIYGRHLRVEFVARLRGEQRFDDLNALERQLARDAIAATQALAG